MKLRKFEISEDVNQAEYVVFRTTVEELKPDVWQSINTLPAELFYNILVKAAIAAGIVEDVVEDNEYDEEVTWEWTAEYVDELPAGISELKDWGMLMFDRWVEIKTLDPN